MNAQGREPGLINRDAERAVLNQFAAGVRAGEGQALVVRGEPGVGKTVLLDYLAGRSGGCRLVRAAGVQSEIGAQLFLSARTVEFHLGKVYVKLGIGSRRELHTALATLGGVAPSS